MKYYLIIMAVVIFGIVFQVTRHDYDFVVCENMVYRCNLRNGAIDKAATQGFTFDNTIRLR